MRDYLNIFDSVFYTGVILLYVAILLFFNYKKVLKMHFHTQAILFSTFVIAYGTHTLMHFARITAIDNDNKKKLLFV